MIENEAKIKVIGVGGGGGNAVSFMASEKIKNIEFIAVNTDIQALTKNRAPIKFTIGEKITKGLGVGGDPEKGKAAAQESAEDIAQMVCDADMIFITAGMGGGTGTGAAPEVARIAREKNKDILIVGVVTKPFAYEGKAKMEVAEAGIEEMKKYTDSMIVVPNSKISECFPPEASIDDAFAGPNNVLKYAIKGITDVIYVPGEMNVDFQDIKSIMKNSGNALIGIGRKSGEQRHIKAVEEALRSPLLENSNIEDATGLIVHMSAEKSDFKLLEFEETAGYVRKAISNDNVKIKFGRVYLDTKEEEKDGIFAVTVIATGFSSLPFSSVHSRPIGTGILRKPEPAAVSYNSYRNKNLRKPRILD
ncbi:MAG: cell division protein FtsZ [Elusimicrobiota bacterium]